MNRGERPLPAELHARLYDLRSISWPGEIDYYLHVAALEGSATRVLEVACGTGRVAIELARGGFAVTGVDVSEEMLAFARAKANDAANPRYVLGDMRTFELDDRFDLALIPAHSFQFMTSADDQDAALRRIHEHLVPGGRLVVHVNHDSLADLAQMDGTERTGDPITELATRSRFRPSYAWTYSHAYQNATLRMAWNELGDENAVVQRWEIDPLVLHVMTAVEMEHALHRAGFESTTVIGSFDGSPFSADSPDMIWSARSGPQVTGQR
jgi:SAM-dependent methyltransferase